MLPQKRKTIRKEYDNMCNTEDNNTDDEGNLWNMQQVVYWFTNTVPMTKTRGNL